MKNAIKSTVKRGRPVNPTSERQKRLKELEAKRKKGLLKRGRPVDSNSERQKRLKELEAKRKNGTLKRGRPSNPNSARQIRLAELAAKKKANGGKMPLGRPKSTKLSIEKLDVKLVNGNTLGIIAV